MMNSALPASAVAARALAREASVSRAALAVAP
jgi:hypothetical protein